MKKKLFVVFMTIAMAVSLVCGMSFMTASASNELTLGDTVTPGANNSVEINWQNMTFTGDDEAELGINDFANITVTRGSTVYNPDFVRQVPSRQTFKVYCLNTGYNFASAERGDLFTIKSGTTFSLYPDITVSADINYIYTGSKWIKGNTIPTEPAEPETPVVKDEITGVEYVNIGGGWGLGLAVTGFSVAGGYPHEGATMPGMDKYVVVTKADGSVFANATVEPFGTQVALMRGQGYTPDKGDEVKFLAGFTYGACYLGEDVRFVYNGSSYVRQLPESAISEIEVTAIGYNESWAGPTVQFELSLADAGAYTLFSAGDKDHLSYVNAYGEVKPLADCTYVNSKNFIARLGSAVSDVITDPYYPMVGDIFTIKKGFLLTHGEVGERINKDFPFIYNGNAFIPYVPATHDVTEFNITNDTAKNEVYAGATLKLTYSANAGALYTPKFTSSDDTVATVSASGLITGVQAGNVTITAKVGSFEKTFAVVVHPALTVEEVRFDRSYTIMAEKGSAAAIPSNFTVVKVFSNGSESEPIALTADNARFKTAVDTSVIPEDPMGLGRMKVTIVVTIDDEEYELEEYVRVYEVADLEITEVAPVEWFLYYSFIEYPNSTFNVCNITSVADLPDFADHIEYYRDGEKIPVGLYILGKGNICVMPARADGKTVEGNSDLDNDNFNERLYKQGDTIKLIAGLTVYGHTGLAPTATDTGAYSDDKGMLYKDAVLKNDVMYRFTGNSWSLYIPYTDMEVASETLEVALGTDNATVGASRIPANATTGKFTYVSSDTTVLTVAENGKINALKEGAATITVTLSSEDGETITKTVSVNVVNKIIRLEISGKLTVKPGTETLDLSKVKGYYVYGNGDRVEATDLAYAIYVGYDPDEKGEQNVVIRVTHEGQQYTANLIVEVKAATQKKGCKSGVASASALSLLGLGVIALAKKKRK